MALFDTALHQPGLNTCPDLSDLPEAQRYTLGAPGWQRLDLPLPLLHPHTAACAERRLELPEGSLIAVASGEAWWADGGPNLPPGRQWDDARGAPLWQWPPPLRWPPPRPSDPRWADQAITFSLSPEARTAWKTTAYARSGASGLEVLRADHPWVPLLGALPVRGDRLALRVLVRRRDELARVCTLGAPDSIVREGHRALQRALVDFVQQAPQRAAA